MVLNSNLLIFNTMKFNFSSQKDAVTGTCKGDNDCGGKDSKEKCVDGLCSKCYQLNSTGKCYRFMYKFWCMYVLICVYLYSLW